LIKDGPLSDEEWEIVRKHPEIGAEIVAPIQKLADIAPVIRAHQEKFDGTGYPFGLKGDEIPLTARVLTVVDAYGAMVEERVYRPSRPSKEAVAELKACAGADFDPQIVDAFISVLKELGKV
jgi:HD-GYP domain-containing protein (c-di-GMP phosphodiesterase class II)